MSKLKSPEEYIREDVAAQYSIYEIMTSLTDDDIIEMMSKMQKDAYNQGIEDAQECLSQTPGQFNSDYYDQKLRILRLKKK